ncbi:hypothetical protein BIW11_06394 [Tropilaelaps mercedesae]|uniref:Ig-like domain-containing protein n=1 Tax=Tropilaelaps mercedesae TaxID=418985 RepID=A0A1V9XYM6_9ACAR|nr:hypothetical protein BIW11_06394 [Tropilaelaps mercedesae]
MTTRARNAPAPRLVKTYRRLPSYFIKMIPHFDNTTATDVVANAGKDVFLPCSVRHLGDRTVSWIRRLPSGVLNVLTVGRHTYTMESRLQPIHLENSESWNLQIRDVRLEDAGVYECQVSTTPKISRLVALRVVESRAVVRGGPSLYVNGGSVLRLVCLVDGAPSSLLSVSSSSTSTSSSSSSSSISSSSLGQTEFVFWFRNGKLLNYDEDQRQRVTLVLPSSAEVNVTKPTPSSEQAQSNAITNASDAEPVRHWLESRLEILSVGAADSGNYTCQPSHAAPDTIQVFVIINSAFPLIK